LGATALRALLNDRSLIAIGHLAARAMASRGASPGDRPVEFLGGLTVRAFLREHWQKKPLLVRNAFPGFSGLLAPAALRRLACRDDAQARLVRRVRGRYTLEHGPFSERALRRLPRGPYSLLVQGVNLHLPAAARLLEEFRFIPHARLDDLMVSYAPPGGGVGPHVDSYDVFLLQGRGRRRWQVSTQRDVRLVEGAPLRILENFRPGREWIVEPGDLLYLPPQVAHHGVALDDCITCSVGFRAPSARELVERFLQWLPDELRPEGIYSDPDLAPRRHPAEIDAAMIRKVEAMLAAIRWDRAMVARFVGQSLSEPKAHVVFARPAAPMSAAAFARAVRAEGVRLTPASLMLWHGADFFVNGERLQAAPALRPHLLALADDRRLAADRCHGAGLLTLLRQLYRDGFVEPGQ
jgi:50S ribosomal protein L16 3-hydroxylase